MKKPPRLIAILAMPGVQLLDVAGPLDVFAEANVQAGREAYQLQVIGCRPGAIESSSGLKILAHQVVGKAEFAKLDTLLVAGAPGCAEAVENPAVSRWLVETAPRARRYGSICSGAFLLARAGLLRGRRATTHWAVAERLAAAFPDISVEPDALYVRDGRVRTAAGVTAGLDLALALVEEDLGREIALKVSAQLVMFFKRPGGQLQFSRKGETAPSGRTALQELQRYVAAHPAENHRVENLAARLELSGRHFARLFSKEVGMTPAEWVTEARVARAREFLEAGNVSPKQVAADCGFADVDSLRRAFARVVGVTPAEYRKRHGGLR